MEKNNAVFQPKPDWLKIKVQNNQERVEVEALLEKLSLNTVCKEANCPNLMECYCKKTATFMILGKECTRDCTFCNVTKGMPERVDPEEPVKVAEAVKSLGLKHVVVTSVTRDDLSDGGAEQFAEVIREIKKSTPEVTIEVLIPDFRGSRSALNLVIVAEPDIISHNIETVPRLYPEVRPSASYKRSLELLMNVKLTNDKILTKSGLMVGLGEKKEEVIETLEDLRTYGCNLLSIGQYLAPSKHHHPVVDYVHPEVFGQYKKIALDMGFRFVASAPFVRSSYHAGEVFETDLK